MDKEDMKVMVITGSSSGLGASLIRYFSAKDYRVVINYRSQGAADNLYDEIVKDQGKKKVLKCKADVSNRAEVRQMFDEVIAYFGRVDILINCAGVNRDGTFLEMTDDQWDQVIDGHLKGHFICSQEFCFHNPINEGVIINLGASAGHIARKNGANFCAAKGGIFALTKAMALELAPRIRVNCLVPHAVKTQEVIDRYDLTNEEGLKKELSNLPLGRLGEFEDLHHMVESIIGAKYTTGSSFYINGGQYMH